MYRLVSAPDRGTGPLDRCAQPDDIAEVIEFFVIDLGDQVAGQTMSVCSVAINLLLGFQPVVEYKHSHDCPQCRQHEHHDAFNEFSARRGSRCAVLHCRTYDDD